MAATILLSSCEDSGSDSHKSIYIYPEDDRDWAVAEPEKYMFDSDKLEKITDYVEKTDLT